MCTHNLAMLCKVAGVSENLIFLTALVSHVQFRNKFFVISFVPRDLVQWQNLHTLDLASNPLHCDCQLAWLRDVLIAAGVCSFLSLTLIFALFFP